MRKIFLLIAVVFISVDLFASGKKVVGSEITIKSPDGRHSFYFYQKLDMNGMPEMFYHIDYDGIPVILESKLDIRLDNYLWERALAKKFQQPGRWCDLMAFDKVEYTSRDTVWAPLYGESSRIPDKYNAATIYFSRKEDKSDYKMNIEVRAYNEGIAFRYAFPMHPEAVFHKVTADNTEFTIPEDASAWWVQWAQGNYSEKPLKDWEDNSERPLVLKLNNGIYTCITEAQGIEFPISTISLAKNKKNTLQMSMYSVADMVTPFATPWRIVMASSRLGGLLENNYLLLNLNDPCRIEDTGWIKPGKQMRVMSQTTDDAIACINFCAAHNMQYIMFDWKWYGPSFDFKSDAAKVVAPIDMPKVISYAKTKGIGVWLYVNQHALQYQSEKVFPLYKKWGVAGVKFGFVEFKTQGWATWLHRIVREAADNNLMVDIHDEYRPVGYSRTYPNLLSQEGVRGNEEFPSTRHNTITALTRMIAGAADFTVCYFDKRIKNTHAHQLAFPVVFYSPLQTFYWYDRPENIQEVPELEFFDKVPVTFDETKVIHDYIGEYVTIARKSGEEWFLGTIGNEEPRNIEIPLSFLKKELKYVAYIYTHDEKEATPTKVKVTRLIVSGDQILNISLNADDGVAAYFYPVVGKDLKKYNRYKSGRVI